MSRYDGLIIPRSYSEYINKTDAATLQQALQLSGVLSGAVAAGDNKAVKSSAVNNALANLKEINIDNTKTDLNFCMPSGNNKIAYFTLTGATNGPNDLESWEICEVVCKCIYKTNLFGGYMQTLTVNSNKMYIRYSGGSETNWGKWKKIVTETDIDGIIYNEFIDDLNLNKLSGSNFLQKHLPNLFTAGVFYSLDMTAVEKNTGKYVRVLYNCKRDTNASFKIKEENGLGVSTCDKSGNVVINGNTNKLIQKTKVLTIVQNGTYVPL